MTRAQEPARHRTRSADVTDSLMDAAAALLAESGPEALTVRAVATRADVAPMGVYSRFGGKPGLLEALFVQGFADLHAAIGSARGADALTRLRNGCRAYREFAVANPHAYRLMFDQMLELELSEESLAQAAATFGQLVERVADAMEAGLIDRGDETEVAQQIWSALHGGVSLELIGVSFAADPKRNFAAMVDTLLRGLASS